MFEVTGDVLDPRPLLDFVSKRESGAVVVFLGTVRSENEGRAVSRLEYEAYAPMAAKEMRRIGEEIRERWPATEVAMQHRVGRLEVGETAVVIAVSSPHRAEAFAACQYAIDRLKEIVPIWKKEVWEGGEAWLEGERGDS